MIRTIYELWHVYRVVEQGSADHALRRQKHDAKPSYDRVFDGLGE